MLPRHLPVQAVYEVASLAVWASFDDGDILELKTGHGDAPFEDPLNLVSFRSRIRDHPDPQEARLVLDELNVPYLVIKVVVI